MFDDVAMVIKEMGTHDPNTFTDEEAVDAVVELAKLRDAFAAYEARVIRRFESGRVYAADGAKNAAVWMAIRTRADKKESGARAWLGRALEKMPAAAEAWAAGEIGACHVRRLAKARNHRTAALFDRDEAMLVAQARELTFAKFSQAVEYWLQHADPDGADQSEMERCERRRANFDVTLDGMVSGSVLLDAVSGAVVVGEFERREKALFDQDWAEAKNRLGRDPLLGELARTPDQRRADALVEMAIRSATPGHGVTPKPLFTVVLGAERFAHLCQLASGQVVSPAGLARWADEALLERILFEPAGQRAIEVSRKRTFTGALRRILEVRDQECTHEYCDEPAYRSEGDHIIPWAPPWYGETSQDNGRMHCGFHNRGRQRPPPPGPPD